MNQEPPAVQSLVQDYPFEFLAIPQPNIPPLSDSNKKHKPNPINVKIRIRNKDDKAHRGIISVPKLNLQSGHSKKVRLINSDQTIMSFDLVVETENNEKITKRHQKSLFQIFKPGVCLGSQNDEEEYSYLPSSSEGGTEVNDIKNDDHDKKVKDFNLMKNYPSIVSSTSNARAKDTFLGKCKPGGCLDPPFSEDKYSYEPASKLLQSNNNEEYRKSNKEYLEIEGNNGLIFENKKKSKVLLEQNKKDNSKIKEIDQSGMVANGSDLLITYPPALTVKELQNRAESMDKRRKHSDVNKIQKSQNEISELFFNPQKTERTQSVEKSTRQVKPKMLHQEVTALTNLQLSTLNIDNNNSFHKMSATATDDSSLSKGSTILQSDDLLIDIDSSTGIHKDKISKLAGKITTLQKLDVAEDLGKELLTENKSYNNNNLLKPIEHRNQNFVQSSENIKIISPQNDQDNINIYDDTHILKFNEDENYTNDGVNMKKEMLYKKKPLVLQENFNNVNDLLHGNSQNLNINKPRELINNLQPNSIISASQVTNIDVLPNYVATEKPLQQQNFPVDNSNISDNQQWRFKKEYLSHSKLLNKDPDINDSSLTNLSTSFDKNTQQISPCEVDETSASFGKKIIVIGQESREQRTTSKQLDTSNGTLNIQPLVNKSFVKIQADANLDLTDKSNKNLDKMDWDTMSLKQSKQNSLDAYSADLKEFKIKEHQTEEIISESKENTVDSKSSLTSQILKSKPFTNLGSSTNSSNSELKNIQKLQGSMDNSKNVNVDKINEIKPNIVVKLPAEEMSSSNLVRKPSDNLNIKQVKEKVFNFTESDSRDIKLTEAIQSENLSSPRISSSIQHTSLDQLLKVSSKTESGIIRVHDSINVPTKEMSLSKALASSNNLHIKPEEAIKEKVFIFGENNSRDIQLKTSLDILKDNMKKTEDVQSQNLLYQRISNIFDKSLNAPTKIETDIEHNTNDESFKVQIKELINQDTINLNLPGDKVSTLLSNTYDDKLSETSVKNDLVQLSNNKIQHLPLSEAITSFPDEIGVDNESLRLSEINKIVATHHTDTQNLPTNGASRYLINESGNEKPFRKSEINDSIKSEDRQHIYYKKDSSAFITITDGKSLRVSGTNKSMNQQIPDTGATSSFITATNERLSNISGLNIIRIPEDTRTLNFSSKESSSHILNVSKNKSEVFQSDNLTKLNDIISRNILDNTTFITNSNSQVVKISESNLKYLQADNILTSGHQNNNLDENIITNLSQLNLEDFADSEESSTPKDYEKQIDPDTKLSQMMVDDFNKISIHSSKDSITTQNSKIQMDKKVSNIALNLGFQIYTNSLSDKVISTFNPSVKPVRYSNDVITIVKTNIKFSDDEIKVPIDCNNILCMHVKNVTSSISMSKLKKEHFQASLSRSKKSAILQKTIDSIYESNLIQVAKVIKSLRQEIDTVVEQQVTLRDNFKRKKAKPASLDRDDDDRETSRLSAWSKQYLSPMNTRTRSVHIASNPKWERDEDSETVDKKTKHEVDLDEALTIAGMGIYNIKYSFNLAMFLISVIIEPIGYAFILPAAKCDLDMTDTQRGFVGSIPYIGIVITSFPWGYLVDTQGRKKMIIYSSLGAGIFSAASAFMPNLLTYALFKFLSALCIACPASVPYTYIGEITPPKYRDIMLSITNAMQITGSLLVPLLAWLIIPLDFRLDFGMYYFRSWRLLTLIYACFFILSAILLIFAPESPKYLISQGRHDESLEVLKRIYAGNKGKPPSEYPVKWLKIPDDSKREKTSFIKSLRQQSVPLLRAPYLKWLLLNSSLFFGLFATLNGLYVWLPDVLNRVLTGDEEGLTACQVIDQRLDEATEDGICDDTIDTMVFYINTLTNLGCAVIALSLSSIVKFIGKKTLLVGAFMTIGIFVIVVNFVTNQILFTIFISSLPVLGLTIGPINAYAVAKFPTNLRGMAIGLTMMIGRMGSVLGSNVAGILLNVACEITFYGFGGMLCCCALLSLLLPRTKKITKTTENNTRL